MTKHSLKLTPLLLFFFLFYGLGLIFGLCGSVVFIAIHKYFFNAVFWGFLLGSSAMWLTILAAKDYYRK